MTALNLAIEDLTEVEKKQLEGQWNLPSGATAYVPITSLFYQQNKGGMGGEFAAPAAKMDTAGDKMLQAANQFRLTQGYDNQGNFLGYPNIPATPEDTTRPSMGYDKNGQWIGSSGTTEVDIDTNVNVNATTTPVYINGQLFANMMTEFASDGLETSTRTTSTTNTGGGGGSRMM